ncbi:MAG TPA: class I SAM-dependent methyltransferase [Myxococcota bacterium]|nr:class I SAM-dependent methyltransferase [Myxococcota bacterium]
MPDAPKSFHLSPAVHDYLVRHGSPPDAVQQELIEETKRLGGISLMQIAPEQGAFMTLLARAIGARRAVEVGTFTGYSALCLARGLAPDGRLLCCDVSEEWTAIARRAWEKAGVASRIELRLGPAAETLAALPLEPAFDLAFIDADKGGYPVYYEEILKRLRAGGLILVDNVLWFGRVADPAADDEATRQIRSFNAKVATDPRVEVVMLAIGDGLTIVRKL